MRFLRPLNPAKDRTIPPKRDEACNTRAELSSHFEGVGSLIFPIDPEAGNFFIKNFKVLINAAIKANHNL